MAERYVRYSSSLPGLQICCGSRVVEAEGENSHLPPYLLLTADRSEAYDRQRRQSNRDAGARWTMPCDMP